MSTIGSRQDTAPRILIIDDEESARYGIARALSNQGYDLDEADNGAAALSKIASAQPDVVVTDVNMPEMDGITLLQHLNQLPEPPLVVLLTAHGSEGVVTEALRAGAHNYLAKPFGVEELRLIVRRAVEKQRLLQENRYYYRELERTLAELRESQAALVQSEKSAALGRLVAGVLHDVNTPVGVIRSSAGVIRSGAGRVAATVRTIPEQQAAPIQVAVETLVDAASQVESAAERLHAILSNLQQFAQVDKAEFRRAGLNAGIESAIRLFESESRGGFTIQRELGDLPEIYCSPRQLNQVVMNLLVNAREAIDRSGKEAGTIRVRTWAEGGHVKIEVSDTGCGIAPENIDKIFDPGFTTKGVRVRTGMGLAISNQMVRAHGGRIEVASTPRAGTTFTILIPAVSGT